MDLFVPNRKRKYQQEQNRLQPQNKQCCKSNKMFYSTQEYISRLVVVVEESSHHFYFRSTQIKISGTFFRSAAKPAKPLFIWISFS